MASEKVSSILETLKGLTLVEAAELAKSMEEEFGVSAAAPMMAMGAMPAAGAAAVAEVEEQTEFDVILKSVDAAKKIAVIKAVRELTSLGLKEAKDLVEGAPKPVREAVSKEEADQAKTKLVEAGGEVEVK